MECASSKAAPSSPAWPVRPSTTAVRTPLAGWAARRPVAPQPSLASAASAFRQGAGAVQVVELPKGRPWQRVLWAVLDDPASSKTASRVSAVMMSVIGVSVVNFCLASVPFNCSWEHGGKVNETVVNSSGTYVVEYLSYAPERRCDPVQPNAPIPFESVEMFCIILFTIEFLLRVAACAPTPTRTRTRSRSRTLARTLTPTLTLTLTRSPPAPPARASSASSQAPPTSSTSSPSCRGTSSC